MPKLFITEYSRLGHDFLNLVFDAPSVPSIAEQRVEFGLDQQGLSEPFSGGTRFVEVIATEDCCLAFGEAPRANATKHWLPADTLRRYGVAQGHRVAVVASEDLS